MNTFNENQAYSSQTRNHLKSQRANERYFRNLAWFLILGLLGYSFHLLDKLPKEVSLDKAYLALGIVWLGFLPSIQYLLDHERPPIPFFPLVGIFYATSFGLPIFATKAENPGFFSLSITNEALLLTLLGVLYMNIAFFIVKSFLLRIVTPIKFFEEYSLDKLLNLLKIFLLAHIASLYIPSIEKIPSVGQLLDPVGYTVYGMFFILWSRGQLSSISIKMLLSICFLLEFIRRFASGALAQVLLLGIFIGLIIWYERKRIPIILVSILLLFFVAFNSIKGEYRDLTWGGPYTQASPFFEKAQLFVNIAVEHYFPSGNRAKEDHIELSSDSAVERTAHIILFSQVVEDTPKLVPYWNGYTYSSLFTSFIPRALWPGKPITAVGNVFGRRYGILNSDDGSTSINLPWIVEMYVNFGDLGVFIGMPLVGILLAFLNLKFNSPKIESLQVVIGATILFGLIYQESNFSLMTGNIITLTLALYFIFRYSLRSKY